MSCGVGRRRGSDPALLWLWHRPVALIGALAWGLSYAAGVALEKAKRPKKTKKKQKQNTTVARFHRGSEEATLTSTHEGHRFDPWPSQCVKDLALLWLWCRLAAVATSLRQSPSNSGSEPRLRPTPQLTATPDP